MFDLLKYPECNISSVSEGIKAFTQGMPSGYYVANHLLKVAGAHSNRTTQQFYDEANSRFISNQVADLEIERLVSQMNIIGSERELIAGLIMLMNSGLLLGHWKKFKFDTDIALNKYRDIFCSQWEFDKGVTNAFISPVKAEPLRVQFNAMHDRVNKIIVDYYSSLQNEVEACFSELFNYVGSKCTMYTDTYQELQDNRLDLLLRSSSENPTQRTLYNLIQTTDNPVESWNVYLYYKDKINNLGSPSKDSLYSLFGVAKKTMQTYQQKFIQHIQRGFGDDFNEIINKLDIEINKPELMEGSR